MENHHEPHLNFPHRRRVCGTRWMAGKDAGMTHTPGSWILNIEDGRAEVCVDGERITDPYIGDENARLIAAAPDLLEALRDCLGRFVDAFPASAEHRPIKRGFAAIAKAEGRT